MSIALPIDSDRLLLTAVLDDGEEAIDAWRSWRALMPLDDVDAAAHRIVPLAYRRLEGRGIDSDPDFGRIKGIYRQAWVRNQLVRAEGELALTNLSAAGIETILLKGAAMQGATYDDLGVRPMADCDLLVRPEAAVEACRALEASGWSCEDCPGPAEQLVGSTYHAAFRRDRNIAIELHWYSMMLVADEEPLWRASVPQNLGHGPARALCAADQLLHIAVHGLREAESHRVIWVVDAVETIRAAGQALDWDRVVAEAGRRRVTAYVLPALRYLATLPQAAVPVEALVGLERRRPDRLERLGARVSAHEVTPSRTLVLSLDRYWRYRLLSGPLPRPGYLTVLRMPWGYRSWPDLLVAAARNSLGSVRRALRLPRPR
jgi:hypothetical protein